MKKTADLTVIVPVYNRAAIVCRSLESIIKQTLPPQKLVIVDNNSTDHLAEIIDVWKRLWRDSPVEIVFCEEKTPGACAARNRGLKESQTAYTQFFDSDDTMHPELIETVFKVIEKDPKTDVVVWKAELYKDGETMELKFRRNNLLINHIHHALLSTQRFLAKTLVMREAGGWNEDLKIWNDWEFGSRVLLKAQHIRVIPKTLVTIYHLEESITGENYSSRAGKLERSVEAVLKNLETGGKSLRTRAHAAMTYAILAGNYVKEGRAELAPATLQKALDYPELTRFQKMLMRRAFEWTAQGRRGAATIFGTFL